ncbi:MAG TPA: hypothetical protein VFG30_15190 [Polyangiales bacterium]|nr:hypothetical protein [Polyangiales bacterium]
MIASLNPALAELDIPTQPAVHRKPLVMPLDANTLILRMRGQSFVSVVQHGRELTRAHGTDERMCLHLLPGDYELETDGETLGIETIQRASVTLTADVAVMPGMLQISSDAPDQHVVDGVGEIKADGASYCTITVRKQSFDGRPAAGKTDTDEIFIRATGGTVSSTDANTKTRIRSMRLKKGEAKFRLVSDKQPRLVQVTVFGRAPALPQPVTLAIEFV